MSAALEGAAVIGAVFLGLLVITAVADFIEHHWWRHYEDDA